MSDHPWFKQRAKKTQVIVTYCNATGEHTHFFASRVKAWEFATKKKNDGDVSGVRVVEAQPSGE